MKYNEKETAPKPNRGFWDINFIAALQISNLVHFLKFIKSNPMNFAKTPLGRNVSKNFKKNAGKNIFRK